MNIIEAIHFFERLLSETQNKHELKIYKNFIILLSNLKNRNFNETELLSLEDKLKSLNLNLNTENKIKYFSKKLIEFRAYLKAEFSLISNGYYTAIGMSLGMCFGVAIGASFGASGISIGISLGMLIGLVIGRIKDMDAEKQNRVLRTKIN